MPRSRSLVLAVAFLLIVAAGAAIWRPSAPNAPPAAPSIPVASPSTAPPSKEVPRREVELLSPSTGYVGSEKCADCHDDEHAAWRKDWHSRALSEAHSPFVVGDFANTHYKGDSSEAWMTRRDEHYSMRTKGPTGVVNAYPVDWVVGGKRMQDPITVMPDGRWQVLPIYFHVTGKSEWVDYSESKQGALTPDHPFFWSNWQRNAQHACLDCHVTGLNTHYDRKSHQWSTGFADAGVACESCHGPGARHVETQLAKDIVQPSKLPPRKGLAVCAQCHGPHRPLFPLLDARHRFQPGERYEDHYQPMVVLIGGGERSGDYFEDGRPKTSSFEYQALTQSRCYQRGGATCLTCHTAPHAEHADNEVKRPKHLAKGVTVGSASCQGCHAKVFAEGQKHTHHTSAEARDCLACHMPPTISGVLDHFADHALDVPVPQNTVKHGIPNACNACHTHEQATPESMAESLEKWWPKAKQRQARRIRLADAIAVKTAADSRQPLEQVVADKKEDPALRGVAARLLAQRFREESVPALKAALATATDPGLRMDLADALASTGPREVADVLAPLLKDSSLWVRQSAAIPLAGVGDPRGLAALEELARQHETEGLPAPHVVLGQLALRRGDLATGIQQLERSLDLQPYNVEVLVVLADAYARQGDMPRARERLEEALRFDPRHRGARQRMHLLRKRGG
ncbi:HEAT repeat domain-containing protein [Archangium violaceum]|uniref:HEAT repeat domain-containing protein n=1 Tax=Archangium violaceum TaxID=83451 RepID=UPI00193BE861|nr:HEAT repeat domain-containing protein [Archangium violaceum]QRK09651.1 HEAT repeat domain-containing protein [Archangium violaceum]